MSSKSTDIVTSLQGIELLGLNLTQINDDVTQLKEDVQNVGSTHNHSASQITSGTLPVSRGGTGTTSLSTLRRNMKVFFYTKVLNVSNPNYFVFLNKSELNSITGMSVNEANIAIACFNADYSAMDRTVEWMYHRNDGISCRLRALGGGSSGTGNARISCIIVMQY